MRDAHDHNRELDPLFQKFATMVRKMAITLTAKALWQLAGFQNPDGTTETKTVEPFNGIGFFSRPPSSGTPEAIVVMVGDAKTQAIIAVRDEKTRAAIAGALAQDESMMFNSQAVVHVKANATVEIRLPNGVPEAMLKGQTYRTAEDTLLTALGACLTALADTPAQVTAAATANTAITTFQAAAANYLAIVGKVQ